MKMENLANHRNKLQALLVHYGSKLVLALTCSVALAAAAPAWSQWELDSSDSSITFITTKNGAVAEQHRFDGLTGFISRSGDARVNIELDSVETLIPIRNERMRTLLFETARFPLAHLTTAVETAVLESLAQGGVINTEIEVTVQLHGREVELPARVVIVAAEGGTLRVISLQPVVATAADFNLVEGIAALQEIAGLQSISTAVPVSFQLLFRPAK